MNILVDLKKNFEISDELAEKVARLFEHLPFSEASSDLLILKGHLLIEEVLNDLIEGFFPKPSSIRAAKLGYYQMLKLAESIYFQQDRQWMWGASNKLNKIRNQLAHNLEPQKIDELINELVLECTPSYVKKEGETIDLRMALIFLYSGMASNLDFTVKFDLTSDYGVNS
jgi:hypothetical protein